MRNYQKNDIPSQHLSVDVVHNNPDMGTLASRLKAERERHKLTQDQLAKKVDPTKKQSLIANIEAGTYDSSTYLPEIAHILRVDAFWLKTGRGSKHGPGQPLSDDQQLILDALPMISEDMRESWLDAARKALTKASKQKAA